MKDYFRKILFLGLSVLCIASLAPYAASAQTSEGIEIKPAIIEDNVKPGQVYTFTLTFTNIADTDRTFYLSAQDIKGLDDRGLPIFATAGEATGYELSSWVNIPADPITVKAGQSVTLSLTARVPSSVSPGAHFGGVFITDKPPKLSASGSGVGMSVGDVMSLTVAGQIVEDARLQEFSTDKQVYGGPTVNFNTKIQNSGNVLVRPHGVIEITDMFGHQVASVPVNDSAAPVFPGSERVYTTMWHSDSFAFGRYEVVGSFSYGDSEKKTISGTTSFWVLPLEPIAIFLGAILGIVVLLYVMIKLYIRRQLHHMGVTNADRSDMNFYAKKYQRSGSRLIIVTLVIFLMCVVFLGVLFFVFA
jgi:hypothetical protein